MPAQSPGTLINAGMPGVESQAKDAACAAFAASVDRYCAKDERERRKNKYEGKDRTPIKRFEDFFKEEMKRSKKKTLETGAAPETAKLGLTPDEKKVLSRVFKKGSSSSSASSSRKAYATMADEHDAAQAPIASPGTAPQGGAATAVKLKSKFGGRFGGAKLVFPDATIEDKAVELKGPGDSEDPKGKFNKHQQVKKDAKKIVVGCKQCGRDCKKGNCC